MTSVLDEAAAWALVRSVRGRGPEASPGDGASSPPLHVPVPGSADLRIEVHGDGRWTAPVPVSPEARDLLDLYLPVALPPQLTLAQMGQSLDGRIATEAGHSHYVTGPADIRRLHRLRALVDAVVVGAGTVASDDPRLTVREVEGPNPVRVVLDPDGRLGPDRRVFKGEEAPTVVVRRAVAGAGAAPEDRAGRAQPSTTVLRMPADGPLGFHPARLLEALRERGLRRVLVEGGGVTVSRFLQAGALDRLHVTVAPLLMGSGRPALTLEPIATLGEALRPRCRIFRLGGDVLFDLDLHG